MLDSEDLHFVREVKVVGPSKRHLLKLHSSTACTVISVNAGLGFHVKKLQANQCAISNGSYLPNTSTLLCSDPCLLSQLHCLCRWKAAIGDGTCRYITSTFLITVLTCAAVRKRTWWHRHFFECKNSLYFSVSFPWDQIQKRSYKQTVFL